MPVQTRDTPLDTGAHAVHFYEQDSELAGTVGRHLARAVRAGDAAVVIATDAHLRAFEAELAEAGIDPDAARDDRALLSLEADATLSRLLSADGQIDADAFDRVIGGVVRGVVQTGRPVFAYGEMVSLLWDRGDVLAAIDLEKRWNELCARSPLTLLCAYHAARLGDDDAAVQEVCHLHTAVSQAASREFGVDRSAPRAARQFIGEAIRRLGGFESMLDAAMLVASELATNAVIHARTPFAVSLEHFEGGLRLAVADRGPAQPQLRDVDIRSISGRGLALVAALCRDWGIEQTDTGKTVWAEIAA